MVGRVWMIACEVRAPIGSLFKSRRAQCTRKGLGTG